MNTIKKLILGCAVSCAAMVNAFGNITQTVGQVSSAVEITNDVDYIITDATPFATAGSVNITNTEHAVVIIKKVRPSVVISTWLKNHVYINGAQAVNGTNCQVKLYASGAIIMPYAKDIKPLTVYSDQNFAGTAVNDFGLEHTGGFMNTLTDAKLNNKIRSFKLKRGYMVTFSTRAQGRGYSRCFIADTEDLEIASLPAVLDKKISSYRVFQWLDAQRKGVHDTSKEANAALGTTWAFDWGQGNASLLPDVDWTSHHIYEDWPSAAACGGVTQTCHMQTNNEPGNSADDHPQDVATVLANWENLMRTGMRLCSESSHDGSMGHLKAFMDSIDARGWRCDVLDLHCYWDSGTFNNLTWYSDYYGNGRPIWISEWVWGASWNNNGAFASGRRNDEATYNGTVPILNILNSHARVERYAYWNSEADFTKIWRGGKLTKLGEYYSQMETGLAYNKKNEFIPKNPRQYAASGLSLKFDPETKQATLKWTDRNGEYNQSMEVQTKVGSGKWETVFTPEQKETEAVYSTTITANAGTKFRVRIVDLTGKELLSSELTAIDESLTYGGEVIVGDKTLYLGGNMLPNGSFNFGLLGWENGKSAALAAPHFQAMKTGGADGGAYLQMYGQGPTTGYDAQTLHKILSLKENGSYYVTAAGCNTTSESTSQRTKAYQRMSTSPFASNELSLRLALPAASTWTKQSAAFTITADTILHIVSCQNKGKAQLDEIAVHELFPTKEEALANALEWAKVKVAMFKQFNQKYTVLNNEIDQIVATGASASDIDMAIANALEAIEAIAEIENMKADAKTAVDMQITGYDGITAALAECEKATTALEYSVARNSLSSAVNYCLDYKTVTDKIKDGAVPSSTTAWTKSGSYTAGDQRTATQAGKTCWNAWWSVPSTNNGTMAIKQNVTGLVPGLYALECKATTQHYCETDQHAYIKKNGETYASPVLPYGVLDIESFKDADKWVTLATPYVYVNAGETVEVGFTSSKAGAVDKSYITYGNPTNTGDNREGWWCATDFQLRMVPLYKAQTPEMHWGTICFPYVTTAPDGVTLYELVGITEDQTRICLKEATDFIAGTPYIYYSELPEVTFYQKGDAVKSARIVNNLYGIFTTKIKYMKNSMRLVGDRFELQTASSEDYIPNYTAMIYPYDKLTVVSNDWDGPVIFTKGLVSEELIEQVKNGIDYIIAPTNNNFPIYNIAGQRINNSSNVKGVVVTKNKKVVRVSK